MNHRDVILGFAAVFLFVKSYANCLVAELSQLCYGGVMRAIALASTDGLCTYGCPFIMGLQPVIVPVGRIALGRIFNVVGSSIDTYIDLSLSSQFNTTCLVDSGLFVESLKPLSSTKQQEEPSLRLGTILSINGGCRLASRVGNQFNTILFPDVSWTFYLACLYSKASSVYSAWTPSFASRTKLFSCLGARIKAECEHLFYNTDVLFAQIKPIHRTPLAIMALSVCVKLFETGIKVVDLLTPYKSGGKIGLFGGGISIPAQFIL
jgi:hypothetical protein